MWHALEGSIWGHQSPLSMLAKRQQWSFVMCESGIRSWSERTAYIFLVVFFGKMPKSLWTLKQLKMLKSTERRRGKKGAVHSC